MYWEKKFESPKSKDKFIIFVQKLVLGGILILVSNVREIKAIFKTTGKIIIFVINLREGQ